MASIMIVGDALDASGPPGRFPGKARHLVRYVPNGLEALAHVILDLPGRGLVLAALVAMSAAGCAGEYHRLRPEAAVPELAALKESATAIGQRTSRVRVGAAGGRPVHVAVHESGPGDTQRVVVLIHGVLSDSRVWRNVRGDLS